MLCLVILTTRSTMSCFWGKELNLAGEMGDLIDILFYCTGISVKLISLKTIREEHCSVNAFAQTWPW